MKLLLIKITGLICLLLLAASLLLAAPAALDSVQLLSAGRMNELIGSLLNHNDAESYNMLSRAYYAIEQWDAAIKNGEHAVGLRGDDSNYHLWLGRAYGQKAAEVGNPLSAAGLARKARNEFERAVELNPANVSARTDLSEYYVEAPAILGGGLSKARNQASEVQNLDPAAADWIRAIAAQKEKRYSEAESSYKAAIAKAQNPAQYWMSLASFYRQQGRLDDMERAIKSAIAVPNGPAVTYFDAANELLLAGREYPAAAQYVKTYLASGELVEDAPAFRAHYVLGQIYEKSGERTQASAEYQASLELASGFNRARKALDQLSMVSHR
jgi:tetratricopeptide (TPR) repeat protein